MEEKSYGVSGVVLLTALWLLFSGCDSCGNFLGVQRMEDGSTVFCYACTLTDGVVRIDEGKNIVWSYLPPEASLNFPHTAFWKPDDTMIISDTSHNRFIIIDTRTKEMLWSSEDIEFELGEFVYANYADLLPNGNLLICSRNIHMVLEMTLDGEIVWSFGEYGVSGLDDTHLNGSHGPMRLENGNTLICDSHNHRVIEVDPQGQIVWNYHPAQGTPGYMIWPRGIDVLPDGSFLIADFRDFWVVNRDKEIVWQAHKNRIRDNAGYTCRYLENGNFLFQSWRRIDELTWDGELVWSYYPPSWTDIAHVFYPPPVVVTEENPVGLGGPSPMDRLAMEVTTRFMGRYGSYSLPSICETCEVWK